MKKLIAFVCVLVLTLVSLPMGCSEGAVVGSGDLETQEYEFTDFNNIEIGSSFRTEIIRSDSYGVTVTADDNLFNRISISQEGLTLRVGLKPGSYVDTTQKLVISMPVLQKLELVGVPLCNISGFNAYKEIIISNIMH